MTHMVIAGGTGFLGSNLVQHFLKKEYQVTVIDNGMTGNDENITEWNDKITFIRHDICEPIKDIGTFDILANFACPASPPHYQKDPIHTLKTNVLGTLNLLELAQKNRALFLQASTSEVYGDPLVHPQREEYWGNVNPVGIRSCYDEGKRAAEALCFDFANQYKMNVKVVRIFNTYGPFMAPDDGRVISNFILQALQNQPMTIYGDGLQTRSLCYVDDLVRGIEAMLNSSVFGPINLGNPFEITMKDLALLIQKLTGSKSELIFKPLPSDDPHRRCPDITKAKKLLNWEPQVSLEEGLLKTIEYFIAGAL